MLLGCDLHCLKSWSRCFQRKRFLCSCFSSCILWISNFIGLQWIRTTSCSTAGFKQCQPWQLNHACACLHEICQDSKIMKSEKDVKIAKSMENSCLHCHLKSYSSHCQCLANVVRAWATLFTMRMVLYCHPAVISAANSRHGLLSPVGKAGASRTCMYFGKASRHVVRTENWIIHVPPKRHGSERVQEFETSESPVCSKILRNAPNLCGQLFGFLSLWADKVLQRCDFIAFWAQGLSLNLKKTTWKRLWRQHSGGKKRLAATLSHEEHKCSALVMLCLLCFSHPQS